MISGLLRTWRKDDGQLGVSATKTGGIERLTERSYVSLCKGRSPDNDCRVNGKEL